MTERTITEEELKTALAMTANIDCVAFHAVVINAFPPIFKPKKGEVIWVRNGKDQRWVLKVFACLFNGEYRCESDNMIKWFDWEYAKPQTPRNKGE